MRLVVLFAILSVLMAAAPAADAAAPEHSNLQIRTATGAVLPFRVEVAEDEPARSRGLMFRERMDADAGMLFIYDHDQPIHMWMKNTYLPLDMLFLAADGVIVSIVRDTVPLSLKVIASPGPVRGVLELNAGTAEAMGIAVGDRVLHPALGG